MAPIIEVSVDQKKAMDVLGMKYNHRRDLETTSVNYDLDKHFIKLPSGIYTARERIIFNKNWSQQNESLKKSGLGMQIPLEFVELLKYAKENDEELYNEITQVRNPWRAENLDAYFERRKNGMYILTHNKTKAEKLDEDTLMVDRTPGISIESWLKNPTSQGLPRRDVEAGDLFYWYPRNGAVARFVAGVGGAGLDCYGDPFYRSGSLGVRAVKRE